MDDSLRHWKGTEAEERNAVEGAPPRSCRGVAVRRAGVEEVNRDKRQGTKEASGRTCSRAKAARQGGRFRLEDSCQAGGSSPRHQGDPIKKSNEALLAEEIHPLVQGMPEGRRTALSNGFYGDLDLSGAPDDNVKVPSRGVQDFAGGPEEPISPESNHTGDSDGTGDSYVKVDSPEQDSPGRQAGPPRRQQQQLASRHSSFPGYTGRHGTYGFPQAPPFVPGTQQYSQGHGQHGSRHPSSNGGHAHHQTYNAEPLGPQSHGMTVMYPQQFGGAAQHYHQGVMMPHGAYPPHVAYMVQPAGTVPWPGHYDSTTHLQGTMRPNTAPVSANTPMMQYYSPHDVMANSYYPQVAPVQQMSPEGGTYYYPSYEPTMQAHIYDSFGNRRSSIDRVSRQAAKAQYQPPSAPSASSIPSQLGFKTAPSAAATGEGPRDKPGQRRQNSPPLRAETDRDPRVGHRRQSSLPGPIMKDRLQIQKGGEAASRRHRRTRSNEESKVQHEIGLAASTLEAIKTNRGNQYHLKDIVGSVYELCKDQFGSRFIQMKVETATPEEVACAFNEVCVSKDTTQALMNDVFGNYVVQKFLDYGTDEQKARMATMIQGSVKVLSLQVYGCRVIQKAIEVLNLALKTGIVAELKGQVIECVADQNGNHVIQKCIECITPSEPIADLLEELANGPGGSAAAQRRLSVLANKPVLSAGIVPLARHPYGCRVVQRILEKCTLTDYKHRLVETVTENALELSKDTYGNYVIQHSLAYGTFDQKVEIIHRLQSHIVELSTHKFASNVVEKCLEYGTRAQRCRLVSTMLGDGSGLDAAEADQLLQTMTKDQYGNYVVQKTLEHIKERDLVFKLPDAAQLAFGKKYDCSIELVFVAKLLGTSPKDNCLMSLLAITGAVCTDDEREVLLAKIRDFLTSLKKQQYGKHIVMRIDKLLQNAATWVAQRKAAGEAEGDAETGSPQSRDVHDAFQELALAPETPENSGGPGEGTVSAAARD
ncbi:hypothetical protein WJX75_002758 [Coccomyxa subellipsoidea]|uniref:PUM-HD domain-containing protein n=1 Tax=Coccomyxa subellipsoidea TaxID=248742 RepID=A0ABR2YG86_9CHLO